MSYNVNFVLGLSAASLAVFAEKELRKVTDEEKLSGPCINRIRDISLIALYCIARNQFSRSYFRSSFDILTLGVSFFHFAQLTPLLKKEDEAFSEFGELLFATYRVACRIFIMLAAFSSIKDNLKELKQEEIAAMAALKRQNILKNYLLFTSEYISLICLFAGIDKGLETGDTEYLATTPSGRSGSVRLPNFLEPVEEQDLNGTRIEELEFLERHLLFNEEMPHVAITGEAGQGKTNLVGQFATLLASKYKGSFQLVKFSKNAFAAHTEWRGQEEGKSTELENFFNKNPTFVLVIDEFHTFVNYGKDDFSGRLGLADKMKEFLEKKEVRMICLTTKTEFDRYVAPDRALARRFPYRKNIKGLDPGALNNLRRSKVKGLIEGLKDSHEILFRSGQENQVVELFQHYAQIVPDYLKSPYFESLVVADVKSRLLVLKEKKGEGVQEQAQSSGVNLCELFEKTIEDMVSQQ